MKKVLILTGGGDAPGLNAVIRGIAKRARKEKDWEILGSIEAFNGVLNEPQEIIKLTRARTAGIHVKGGTILKTTNKSNPIYFWKDFAAFSDVKLSSTTKKRKIRNPAFLHSAKKSRSRSAAKKFSVCRAGKSIT